MSIEITVAILAGILCIFFLYKAAGILFQDAKDEYERYNDRLTVTVNKNGSSSLSVDLKLILFIL